MKRLITIFVLMLLLGSVSCAKNSVNYSRSENSLSSSLEEISIDEKTSSYTSDKSIRESSTFVSSTTSKLPSKAVSISQDEKEKRISQVMNGKILESGKYTIEAYTSPYWEGNIIYNESLYPLRNKDGSMDPLPLMYYADKIIAVRSPNLQILYSEGKDYVLVDGKLVIPANSTIPIQQYDRFYLDSEMQGKSFARKNGGFLFFSEGITFHSRQIAVTYAHINNWEGPIPSNKGNKLPSLMKKLADKGNINIVFYGDSITQGANSSGAIGTEPNAPSYINMFSDLLKDKYGVTITSTNSSEGGQISSWGLRNVEEKVNKFNPDLVVIAFGMNDGTMTSRVAPSTYQENVTGIINAVRSKFPNCEFLLVSTMLPNPDLQSFTVYQAEYPASLLNIENQNKGVVVANVTEMHKYVMSKKRYADMTGNNVNHPNDFIARLYVQTLFKTIQK